MTEKTLIEVQCMGCEAPFYTYSDAVGLEANPNFYLCRSCKCFKAAMEHMMRPRESEQPGVGAPFFKGFGIGFLLMSALLGACWMIVSWLR